MQLSLSSHKSIAKDGRSEDTTSNLIGKEADEKQKEAINVAVEQTTKMQLTILLPKDRPKIQDTKKIQDTDDVMKKGIPEAWQMRILANDQKGKMEGPGNGEPSQNTSQMIKETRKFVDKPAFNY